MQMFMKQRFKLMTVYGVIIICFCLTFGVGMFAMTLEPDEVWILMSTMKAFGIPLPPTSAVNHPVITSGGVHFVLHGLIALVWGADILVHRFVSIGVVLILLGIVFKLIEYHIKDRILALAGTALFATAPGFLLQASLATAEIIATTIFLLAVFYWIQFGSRSVGMALLGGFLFGLACATRMTCLSMLPAILIWSVLIHRSWAARIIYPVLSIAVAVFVFVGFVAAYSYTFSDSPSNWNLMRMSFASDANGLGRSFEGFIMRLNYMEVANGIIPVIAIVALAGWFINRLEAGEDDRKFIELCGFLLLAGCIGWFSWVLKAPIPHIRYLWPVIPVLWLVAILLGLSAMNRVQQKRTAVIAHLAIIIMCAFVGLRDVRMLAVGDSLRLVYEAAHLSRLGTPEDFFIARRNQNEIAALLKNLPAFATIYALSEPAAYPMTYLSVRRVKAFTRPFRASAEDYLLVQPSDRFIWLPKWDLIGWLQDNTTLVEHRGGYDVYRVHEGDFLVP